MRARVSWSIALFVAAHPFYGQAAEPPKTYEVTFAQLTDAHIFDDGKKLATPDALRQADNDRRALDWAIAQINRTAASGTKIDFVVYTGDFGLENVTFPDGGACRALPVKTASGLPSTSLAPAVNEVAAELDRLEVRRVFLVAGNNDIRDEDVTDARFDCFVAELQKRVRSFARPLEVDMLRPDRAFEINGVRLAGLNTASFKSQANYAVACGRGDRTLVLACPGPQMESLRETAKGGAKSPLILFTHIPDLIDPYFHKNNPGVRKSAWEIPADARSIWEQEVCGPNVMAVFAGHFHDSNPAVYGSNSTTADLAYTPCVAGKTWVAPPLALKNQERALAKARGFLLVRVADGKVADVQVKWFDGPAPAAAASAGAGGKGSWLPRTFEIAGFAAAVLGIALLSWLFARLDEKSRDSRAFVAAVAFLFSALMVVRFCRHQLGVTDSATLIALVVCPLLVYGVVSGRLTEFSGPGGWGAKFGQAARSPVELSSSPIDVTSAQDIAKGALAETQEKIRQIRSGKPVVMTMTIGSHAAPRNFQSFEVAQALANLSAYPNFKFVVFLDPGGGVVAYIPGWMLLSPMTANSPQSVNLLAAANRGDAVQVLQSFPGMLTETISPRTTNVEALEEMERLELDAVPVADPATRSLRGVVERERIVARMFLTLAKA